MTTTSDELHRVHRAAQLYYEEGATQAEVAAELGISRSSVSRMLSEARRLGIVEIQVRRPAAGGVESLGRELAEALGIRRVRLAPGDQSKHVGPGLAPQARESLHEAGLRSGDALLVASGETTYALAQQRLGDFSGVVVAPTVGGQAEPDPEHQTNEVVRAFTASNGGRPHYLFAPSMPSEALAEALRDDPGYQQIIRDWESASALLMGIGAPTMTRRAIAQSVPRSHPSLARSVGDVCLAFLDREGKEVDFPGRERFVRIPQETLRRIPVRIAAAVGGQKAPSIRAAAKECWFTTLITDEATARAVLAAKD
ncbi:sugar-binding transcriptional regulator [Nesterenkonia populi]|uniref:sugar-binding transcriptional regulator n=1 Tax=Nesterenkonia populi TaxID=1591087 RepID=UPI0011BDF871|nr:sugar-binding domain-containing protein [Nesterenkonia populi]